MKTITLLTTIALAACKPLTTGNPLDRMYVPTSGPGPNAAIALTEPQPGLAWNYRPPQMATGDVLIESPNP